jgi:hypothetical protein
MPQSPPEPSTSLSSAQRLQELRGQHFTAHDTDPLQEEIEETPRLHAVPAQVVHPSHTHAAHVMEAAHTPPEEAREKARQRGRKRRRGGAAVGPPAWKRVRRLVGFLLIVAWVEVGAAALTTKHFAVDGVEMSGMEITPAQALQPVAASLVGQNWIRAKTHPAELEAEKIPTVRDAKVTRVWDQWPPRLALQIQEREPFARVGGGNHWWVVDRAGVAFRAATKTDDHLYAVTASALPGDTIEVGETLPPKLWSSVVKLADVLSKQAEQGQKWALRRTYIDKFGFASLRLEGGTHDEMLVRLGAGRWAEKLERARLALAYFDATGKEASALNLVSFSMPTWTPRVQATPSPEAGISGENSTPDENNSPETENSPRGDEENETQSTDAT